MSRKLAVALAGFAAKTDADTVTVEDLLNYFPMRYEDRSNFLTPDKLEEGMEASVEINVRVAGGVRVGKNRGPKQPPLFIFEITGGDAERKYKPVVVKWFVSGRNAGQIVDWYETRFKRGTRFVAHGLWEMDERRGTFSLKTVKPEELEILPSVEMDLFDSPQPAVSEKRAKNEDDELLEDLADPRLTMIHTGRRVPVYRKLGPFQTKRLREIIHGVLSQLDTSTVIEDLPTEILERQRLVSRSQALAEIHFPPENALLSEYEMFRSPAHQRLIFDEFFWLSFSMQLLRGERQKEPKGTVIEITERTKERLKNILPFTLTEAQKK